MKDFFNFVKMVLVMSFTAGLIAFVVATSFWWGTYFSIRMILDMIAEVFC